MEFVNGYRSLEFKNATSPNKDEERSGVSYFYLIPFIMFAAGLLKGLAGQFWKSEVGAWGLDYLIKDPPRIPHYAEPNLQKYSVVYDEEGWPVHPVTGNRLVRTLPLIVEVLLNSIFFIVIPVVMMYKGLQKLFFLCCMCCTPEEGEDDDKLLLPKYDCDCVYTKKTEEADTLFVIRELEKSKESLAKTQGLESGRSSHKKKSLIDLIQVDPRQSTSAGKKDEVVSVESNSVRRRVAYLTIFEREASSGGAVGLRASLRYCVRGFITFLPNGETTFSPDEPMYQHWTYDGKEMIRLHIPRHLNAKKFAIKYASSEVMKKNGRISKLPPYLCINTKHQKPKEKYFEKKCGCSDGCGCLNNL